MKLTILTPTYNRGNKLYKLYMSLIQQTNRNFEWLIIDDGSNDNTKEIVEKFMTEKKILIRYYKKQNGGKHTALNMGIKKIENELTFIVDSDDTLTNNAIDEIISLHKKYAKRTDICGYSFLRQFSDGRVNGKKMHKNEIISDYITVRINGNDMNSDKAEIWKTMFLKEYPFPEFNGEKFIGEDFVWLQLALKYKMVFSNKTIYISEYLEEGLTKNRRKNNINSPNGCFYKSMLILNISKCRKIDLKYKIKNILQYTVYGKFASKSLNEMLRECNSKMEFLILYPISFAIYLKWKKEYIV